MEQHPRYLFCLDIDGIQDYIFQTDKLKTIAGASAIVSHLNNERTNDLFEQFTEASEMIYSDGGATKIIFQTETESDAFAEKIHREYAEFGISITTHSQPFLQTPAKTLEAAEIAIQRKKLQKNITAAPAGSPYFRICDACGSAYASQFSTSNSTGKKQKDEYDDPLLLCRACEQKENQSIKRFSFPGIENLEFESHTDNISPDNGWLAWVLIDGNAVGRHVQKLLTGSGSSHETAFGKLRNFSNHLRAAIGKALHAAIAESGVETTSKISFFRPIIIGGDDIFLVMEARRAYSFTKNLIKELEKQADNKPDSPLTFSAGMVIAKHKFPFNVAYRIGDTLLKSAKKRWIDNPACSMIDFHILHSGTADSIEKIRQTEYSYHDIEQRNYRLTRKPYTRWEWEKMQGDLKKLTDALGSRTKLKQVAAYLRYGKEGAELELNKLAAKMTKTQSTDFIECFVNTLWKEQDGCLTTELLDLIELSEFVSSG